MIILGIDPGFATVGFGLISTEPTGIRLLQCGVITTPSSTTLPQRLLQISEDLDTLITTFHPQVMAVEELFFTNNITTGIGVAQARGVILLGAQRQGLEVFEYSPSKIKLAVAGYGKAEKKQVMEMTRRMLGLATPPKPDDAADAVAVALCHSRSITSRLPSQQSAKVGTGRYGVKKG